VNLCAFYPFFFFIPSESNQDAIPDDSIVSNSNATNSSKLILFVALSKLNFDLIGGNKVFPVIDF